MGNLRSKEQWGPFGHDYGKQPFQTRSKFSHGGRLLISCPHKIILFEEECWQVHGVASVNKRLNRFYMFSGVVGRHRMSGLGVQVDFKNLVLHRMIFCSWSQVLWRSFHWKNGICSGLFVGRFGIRGIRLFMEVFSNILQVWPSVLLII